MVLRLPVTKQSVRRPAQTRRVVTVAFASVVLVLLPLRFLLAALSIATWTSAWRTVDLLSTPFVAPFRLVGAFDHTLVGNAAVADVAALLLFGGLSLYLLALLTVRRKG